MGLANTPGSTRSASRKSQSHYYDLIVVGGGPGGVPAAIAAARNGARVLLVERYGFLGGMATTGLVNPYMSFRAGEKVIIKGLFEELLNMLAENGALLRDRQHFEAEAMKWLLDEWCLQNGVDLLLHAFATGVRMKDSVIEAVEVHHKGGREAIAADLFIDSTGDGDIAALAGAPFEIGRTEDGACQPMTTCFRMANVDTERVPSRKDVNTLYDKAKEAGEVKNPRENVLFFSSVNPAVIHFNTTRIIGKSALSAQSLTEAELIGRQQIKEMVRFLKSSVPGFENAYLMKIAPQIGIRESRRISGHYALTADDLLSARKFDDAIGCGSYGIDIHNPGGTGTVIKHLQPGEWYQIPYRSLIPQKISNLLIGSRCISSTHEAHSAIRIMPIVAAIGQAAGTAAALSKQKGIFPVELNPGDLRSTLLRQKAFLSNE
ncbi:FAD-dependent oxidoreductase [candidate division KSB1 bacterium]|nr:FAD-dependent oxidoreductase [candidate division KSB1 bacterium]